MEKERLDKLNRFYFLENQHWFLRDVRYSPKKDSKRFEDFAFFMGEIERELMSLYRDLYPCPTINLFEDIDRRRRMLERNKEREKNKERILGLWFMPLRRIR